VGQFDVLLTLARDTALKSARCTEAVCRYVTVDGGYLALKAPPAPKVRDGVHRRPLSRDLTYYCSESQKSQSCSAANAEVVIGMGSCNDWY